MIEANIKEGSIVKPQKLFKESEFEAVFEEKKTFSTLPFDILSRKL